MLRIAPRIVLASFLLVAASLAIPSLASAQMLREFEGELQSVNDKKIVVDNKKGDKISFERVEDSVVEGEKKAWDELKKNDWVSVHSKMLEKPRKAYKVVVKPAKVEAGETEE
jgi:hypothetical protein